MTTNDRLGACMHCEHVQLISYCSSDYNRTCFTHTLMLPAIIYDIPSCRISMNFPYFASAIAVYNLMSIIPDSCFNCAGVGTGNQNDDCRNECFLPSAVAHHPVAWIAVFQQQDVFGLAYTNLCQVEDKSSV